MARPNTVNPLHRSKKTTYVCQTTLSLNSLLAAPEKADAAHTIRIRQLQESTDRDYYYLGLQRRMQGTAASRINAKEGKRL
jgi:hypothetical protein